MTTATLTDDIDIEALHKLKTLTPSQAAGVLGKGWTVENFAKKMRRYQVPFTEIADGGQPGDRGANRWCVTWKQLDAFIDALAMQCSATETNSKTNSKPDAIGAQFGKSRLKPRIRGKR